MKILLPNNWHPRYYQTNAWDYFAGGGKRAILLWPRRHGKDDLGLNWTAVAAHQRIGSYWHVLPKMTQARKAIWDAVDPHQGLPRIDLAFPEELRRSTRSTDMFIEFKCGSTWQVLGSDNYDRLVGTSPAGIVYSEWALSEPNSWTYLSPILEENDGWAAFVSTVRGENHCTAMYDMAKRTPGWFAELLTAQECGVFSQEQLDRIRSEMIELLGDDEGDAKFRQEYMNDRTAQIPGAYYAKLIQRAEDEGRIGEVPHMPGFPVHTAWDLGVSDDTAIWFFQRVGIMTHLIDYYEKSGEGADHYAEVLHEKRKDGHWVYGDHIGPHDARVREWGSGKARFEILDDLNVHMTIQSTTSLTDAGYRADGINQARMLLRTCRFDATRCARGIAALRHYHREWDEDRKVFSKNPEHDFSSHGADAFRVLAMSRPVTPAPRKERRYGKHRRGASAWATS